MLSSLFLVVLWAQAPRCATMERLQYLIQQDPTILDRMAQIEAQTPDYIASEPQQPHGLTNNVITIPVVVHIVYRTAAENISDAQVQSQIQVLNEDFRRLNAGDAIGGVTERVSRSEAELNFGVCSYTLKEGRGIDGIRIEAAKVFVENLNLRLHLGIGNVFRRRAIDNMNYNGNGDDIIGAPMGLLALRGYVGLSLSLYLSHSV